jgi:SAM-dependent methyltransferase
MSQDWVGTTPGAVAIDREAAAPFVAPGLIDRSGPTLRVGERAIRRIAHHKSAERDIVFIFLRQAFYESRVRLMKKVSFRWRENDAAVRAYCAMSAAEFRGINARQRWANWRFIPRNLDGRLPAGPVKALDLCCGVGDSTDVLAFYLAPGSEILGLEYNPEFVESARRRELYDENGRPARVRFRVQSVLETFREADGTPVLTGSVDLANSCGAVGSHFDRRTTAVLLDELRRVLKPGGLATIDSGPDGTTPEELVALARKRGFTVLNQTRSCVFDRFAQLCLRSPLPRNGGEG